MSISRTYRSVSVNQVEISKILAAPPFDAVHVGIDVGKNSLFVVLRWTVGTSAIPQVIFDPPWKVNLHEELSLLISPLKRLHADRSLMIAFEWTGAYGDPLRQSLHNAGLPFHQVRGKISHDYAEIFDGVPSKHDGKDAAVIADLAAHGKSRFWNWQPPDEYEREMNYPVSAFLPKQLE
jgi:transposase